MNLEAALEYARKHQLQALVASRNGHIELETYENGFTRDDAHPLYSGTKSFWGVAALAASEAAELDVHPRRAGRPPEPPGLRRGT